MKEYNRQTKRWEEPQEKVGSLKTKKLCRGNKPHDYQVVLPFYVKTIGVVTPEAVFEYYESEKRKIAFVLAEQEKMKQLGIIVTHGFGFNRSTQYLECSVCGKKEYEYEKRTD